LELTLARTQPGSPPAAESRNSVAIFHDHFGFVAALIDERHLWVLLKDVRQLMVV
jgi:hypothetical protein